MNLIGEGWIPVTFCDGRSGMVGLRELYERGAQISDLAVTPPERIALMRLLLCITQAALNGPADEEDWSNCRERIAPQSIAYLERQYDCFELYGEKPFLQIGNIEPTYNAPLDKLDFALASGNNATLFDQDSMPEGRDHPDTWRALKLLTYQCFSPGGLAGSITWNGEPTSRSGEGAPCIESSALHTLVRAENMLLTIWNNLIPVSYLSGMDMDMGYPFWEKMPVNNHDTEACGNARSYLGGLAPLSRIILLEREKQDFTLGHGLSYPRYPTTRNMMTSVVPKGKDAQGYLSINLQKAPWRDLAGILAASETGTIGGALALRHFVNHPCESIDIWVGGLVADKAKLIDAAEWVFNVPGGMMPHIAAYATGIVVADEVESALKYGIDTFREETKTKGSNAYNSIRRDAVQGYWTALEKRSGELIEICSRGATLEKWAEIVRAEMLEAYRRCVPHQTPRLMEAYVKGEAAMRKKSAKSLQKITPEQ